MLGEQKIPRVGGREKKKEISLSDLDVKGREIKGLEPKMERFSQIPASSLEHWDWNTNIEANISVEDAFIFINPTGGEVERKVEPPHWRSISQPGIKASVKTPSGREHFYTVNTKGVGYLKPSLKGEHGLDDYPDWIRIDENGLKGAYGLSDHGDYFYNGRNSLVKRSTRLLNLGLRTEMFWYISKLKDIYYQGGLTPVHELRKQKIIPPSTHYWPEMGVRLMKTNTRIAEVFDSEKERAEELFKDAYEVFNKELSDSGREDEQIQMRTKEGDRMFFMTFAKRMGKNLAILINNGYLAWHLHSANVTMAAEIVDIGPIVKWRQEEDPQTKDVYSGVRKGTLKDLRDVAYTLRNLHRAGKKIGLQVPSRSEFNQAFLDAFVSNLEKEQLEKEKVSEEDLVSATEKIYTAILVERRRLGALKHGFDVTDWGIGLEKQS